MRSYEQDLPRSDAHTDLAAEAPDGVRAPRLRRRTLPATTGGEEGESLMGLIRDIPNFLRLLGGLATDPRVSRVDKGLVLATLGYLAMPMDLIPDWIPFLGQVDDIYLLALALDRLLNHAGAEVLMDHWTGDVASLEAMIDALDRAGSFLPERIRELLGQRVE